MTSDETSRVEAGVTKKGARRATQILNAALEIVVEVGYAELTLDAVARRVGISKGNLQYYYPTRSDLLQAAFAEHIGKHKTEWCTVHDRPADNTTERLRHLIAFEFETNRDPKFVARIRERWSLAERDRDLRRLSNEWHGWVTGRYAKLVGAMRPDLDNRTCRQTAIAIYAMLIGSGPYFGPQRAVPQMSRGLDLRIENAIVHVIETAGA